MVAPKHTKGGGRTAPFVQKLRPKPRGLSAAGVGLALDQLGHRRAINEVLRPAGRVDNERRRGVEAEVAVDGRNDLGVRDRTRDGEFAKAIGGADRLARADAAASEE